MPLALKPPNGATKSIVYWFTPKVPVRTRRAMSIPIPAGSAVHTEPARPNSLSLAMRTASSTSS